MADTVNRGARGPKVSSIKGQFTDFVKIIKISDATGLEFTMTIPWRMPNNHFIK
jgi:hypothetical protein